MKARIWLSALILILWPAAPELDAGELLTMTVSPVQSFAPADVRVLLRLEPSADNRALEVVADSTDFYRSSLLPLDGDRAPRIVTLEFRSLPSGQYEIHGVLMDSRGHERAEVSQQATVIPSGRDR